MLAATQQADCHCFDSSSRSEYPKQKRSKKTILDLVPRLTLRLFCVFLLFQTRLCVRLYILRSKQPSIGVADDFFWEALYECDYIAGWSSVSVT